MNTLIKEIEYAIASAVGRFSQRIAEKYNIEVDELTELWASGGETENSTRVVQKKVTPKKPNASKLPPNVTPKKVTPAKSDAGSTESTDGCPYLFTKGAREGENCGSKPKSGAMYCSRHKKYEGTAPKQKKVLPTAKKSVAATVKSKKSPDKKTVNKVLRKNKALDKLWHADTGMVFKSAKDRIVIGKCVDDELQPLTAEDIYVCMAHSFKYEEPEKVTEEPEKVTEEPEKVTEEDGKLEEEDGELEEEDGELEEEAVAAASKAARKITAVPQKISTKKPTPRKAVPKKFPKKTLADGNAKSVKKSIAAAIAETKIQAADVEEILGELQTSVEEDELVEEEVFEEEEDGEVETEDDYEEYDEELLEEEDE
jgi:hypothetical protein